MSRKNDGLRLEDQLCFPLYACSREIIKKYRPFLDSVGLTYTQYLTMIVMWESRRISVKEMGKRLFLDSGTLTPVLKSLEAKGLVKRYRSPDDERVLLAEVTADGMALREKTEHIPEKVCGCIKLSSEEAEFLRATLFKLLDMSC